MCVFNFSQPSSSVQDQETEWFSGFDHIYIKPKEKLVILDDFWLLKLSSNASKLLKHKNNDSLEWWVDVIYLEFCAQCSSSSAQYSSSGWQPHSRREIYEFRSEDVNISFFRSCLTFLSNHQSE